LSIYTMARNHPDSNLVSKVGSGGTSARVTTGSGAASTEAGGTTPAGP
jgi:hypothetical protein